MGSVDINLKDISESLLSALKLNGKCTAGIKKYHKNCVDLPGNEENLDGGGRLLRYAHKDRTLYREPCTSNLVPCTVNREPVFSGETIIVVPLGTDINM
jgi:hypothetical protein